MKTNIDEVNRIPLNQLLVHIDTSKNLTTKIGDLEISLDNEYTRMQEEFLPDEEAYIPRDGIVMIAPDSLKAVTAFKSWDLDMDLDVKEGDHIYFHHFAAEIQHEYSFNGKDCFFMPYVRDMVTYLTTNIYCKVKDGEITMVGDWNLIKPIESKSSDVSDTILTPDASLKDKENIGVLKAPSPFLSKEGFREGDTLIMNPDCISTIIIEGNKYFLISDRDVYGKMCNGHPQIIDKWSLISKIFTPYKGVILMPDIEEDLCTLNSPSKYLSSNGYKPGDKVFLNKRGIFNLFISDKNYEMIKDEDVFGKED